MQVILAGGGARSAIWSQLMADCMGATIVMPRGREFGAKGAAASGGTFKISERRDSSERVVVRIIMVT
ncbi:MAG: hypothetical protein J7551_05680 [Chloroflexi bacterium]|nr:hypothetical protein [Chloroflexota bacterium]